MRTVEYRKEYTKKLWPLKVGATVWIQNQSGPERKKWDKTGVVVEVRQHDQYVVNFATLRNRNFLRVYSPLHTRKNHVSDFNSEMPSAQVYMRLLNHKRQVETPNEFRRHQYSVICVTSHPWFPLLREHIHLSVKHMFHNQLYTHTI